MAKFKRIAISAIGSDDIIIVRNTKNIREQIKAIAKANESLQSNPVFDEGIIYRIPISSSDIESYTFSSTFQRSYDRDEDVIEGTEIEYLALNEDERRIYAEKFNVDVDWNDFYHDDDSYNNLTKTGEGGHLVIERDCINIECKKYAHFERILSETLLLKDLLG